MSQLGDPERLAALRRSGLLDAPGDVALDAIARLASQLLAAPVCLVSLVDEDRQFFSSAVGLGEPWASARQTPLSHSFCKHVVEDEEPLVVIDSRTDDRVAGNLAIDDLGVVSYCGLPITDDEGFVLGSFCVIDHGPRDWDDLDVGVLADLRASLATALRVRRVIDDHGLGDVSELLTVAEVLAADRPGEVSVVAMDPAPSVEVVTVVYAHVLAALMAHALADGGAPVVVRIDEDVDGVTVRVRSSASLPRSSGEGQPFGVALAADLIETTGGHLEASDDRRETCVRLPVRSRR